jgi:hypothetical protein
VRLVKEIVAYDETCSQEFAPLQCNAYLEEQPYISWSEKNGNSSRHMSTIVIPCGECSIVDIPKLNSTVVPTTARLVSFVVRNEPIVC